MDPRNVVTDEVYRLDPTLLGTPLARPWRRGVAMAIDGVLVALLANAPGVLFGFAAALVLFRASASQEAAGYARRAVRLTFRLSAAVILFSVVISAWGRVERGLPGRSSGGVQAASLGAGGPAARPPVPGMPEGGEVLAFQAGGPLAAAPAGTTDADARVERLQREVRELRAELAEERADAPGVLGWLRTLSEDLGLEFGWMALYFTGFLALWQGRTPGKRLLGIRVIRLDGKPLGWWASFERFGGYAASLATGLLGFFHIAWDRNRQGFHDKIAETVVIRG